MVERTFLICAVLTVSLACSKAKNEPARSTSEPEGSSKNCPPGWPSCDPSPPPPDEPPEVPDSPPPLAPTQQAAPSVQKPLAELHAHAFDAVLARVCDEAHQGVESETLTARTAALVGMPAGEIIHFHCQIKGDRGLVKWDFVSASPDSGIYSVSIVGDAFRPGNKWSKDHFARLGLILTNPFLSPDGQRQLSRLVEEYASKEPEAGSRWTIEQTVINLNEVLGGEQAGKWVMGISRARGVDPVGPASTQPPVADAAILDRTVLGISVGMKEGAIKDLVAKAGLKFEERVGYAEGGEEFPLLLIGRLNAQRGLVTVPLDESKAYRIEVIDESLSTAEGAHIGTSFVELREMYGKGTVVEDESGDPPMPFWTPASHPTWTFALDAQRKKVTGISLHAH